MTLSTDQARGCRCPHEGREVPGGSAVLGETITFLLLRGGRADGTGSGLQKEGPANVGRRLIEAPRQVRTSEREKGSMLVGRLVEASGLLKMSSVVRLVEASGMLKMSSVVRAARLHLRRGRSSQLNGWELLLLFVHVVVPAT